MTLEAFALATRTRPGLADGDDLLRRAGMAAMVSDALQFRGNADTNRLMPGAGLFFDGGSLFPTVLADRSIIGAEEEGLTDLTRFDVLQNILGFLLGGWPENLATQLRVLPVSEGFLLSAPGTKISGTTGGRVGPHVRWGSSGEGFLTAGHVAQTVGASVTDLHGAAVGTVLWSNDPATAPTSTGDVDAALVAFSAGHTALPTRSSAIAGVGDRLAIASTAQGADVFGFFGHVRMGAALACYADCYATDTNIARRGDSGGLVEVSGDVAGMVIGGFAKRDMTMVQTIDYQLTEIRRRSGYMISL